MLAAHLLQHLVVAEYVVTGLHVQITAAAAARRLASKRPLRIGRRDEEERVLYQLGGRRTRTQHTVVRDQAS